jgi:hypothetical protein
MDHTPFLTMFPGCEARKNTCGGLENVFVTDARVDVREMTVQISARFPVMPAPSDITALCDCIKADYALAGVGIVPDYPKSVRGTMPLPSEGGGAPSGAGHGNVLFGRAIKQKSVPMNTLTLESGRVTIEGDVVAVELGISFQ